MAEYKPRVNVTVNQDLIDWMDLQIDDHVFANRSHAVEACLSWYKRYQETGILPPR